MKSRESGIAPIILLIILAVISGGVGLALSKTHLLDRFTLSQFSRSTAQYTSATELSRAHNSSGFEMLHELHEKDKESNLFISPTSIELALSMAYNGADTVTKTEMAKAMHISGLDVGAMNKQSQSLVTTITNADPNVDLAIANSIWTKQGTAFNQTFLKTNTDFFKAKVQSLNFNDPRSTDTINSWVKESTRGKIDSIVSPPLSDFVMFLVNAVYFKGQWTYTFDQKLTKEQTFTNQSGQKKQHPLMSQKRPDFEYFENGDFQAIRLPYGDTKKLGMYVFLPKGSLENFSNSLTEENWHSWLPNFKRSEGTILLPKFKNEYEIILNQALMALGIQTAFSDSADFSKMSINGKKDFKISEVKHKTFVEVNEEGTEAAAVTSIGMVGTTSISVKKVEPFYMNVNKPFFFAITEKDTGEILFLGTINDPKL